jgi:GPI ethanolamine phosphate transferase 1
VVLFLTFSPTFIILTISYEGLFYFVFCMTLVTWVRFEHAIYALRQKTSEQNLQQADADRPAAKVREGESRALTISDARVALFFFFLLQSAFFGTGNIASVSSFSLDSVYRLMPVFDPFGQGALLVIKLLIPFAVISANLGILNRRLEVAPSALFMLVMAISDVMTLNFFYMVRDEGSWLDIGTTISHFFIASLLCVFVAGLEFLSEAIISGVEFGAITEPKAAPTVKQTTIAPLTNSDGEATNGIATSKYVPEQDSRNAETAILTTNNDAQNKPNSSAGGDVAAPAVNGEVHLVNGTAAGPDPV